jgi:hypothetical protein
MHRCFFLVNRELSQLFGEYTREILSWQPYYGTGVCIDGQYWRLSVVLSDGPERVFVGENGKPDNFDGFCGRLETLIGKQIEYRPYHWG